VCGLWNGTIVNALEWPWTSLFRFETFLVSVACDTEHDFTNIACRAICVCGSWASCVYIRRLQRALARMHVPVSPEIGCVWSRHATLSRTFLAQKLRSYAERDMIWQVCPSVRQSVRHTLLC